MKRQWHRIDIGHIQWHRQRFSNVCVCLTAIFSLYMANIFSIYYDSDSVFNWEKHKPRSLTPLIIPEYFCLSINETFSFFVVMNTPVEYHFNYPLKLCEMTTGDVAEYQPFIGSDEVPCGIANVRTSYCGITEFRYSYVRKTHTHYTEYDTWCPIEQRPCKSLHVNIEATRDRNIRIPFGWWILSIGSDWNKSALVMHDLLRAFFTCTPMMMLLSVWSGGKAC